MSLSQLHEKVREILTTELPSGHSVVSEGRALAEDVRIGRTAFMDKMGVASEAEYKQQRVRDGEVMFHAHLGMSSWRATADALVRLFQSAEDGGFVIDRAGLCLDRRMGLPREQRKSVPAETGPTLESPEDWAEVGRAAPIQPHMGDFMIGFPAATENTINALTAGITTIGNLSQFFAHEVPMWRDTVTTTVETVRAMSIMGALRQNGTLVHSYLEDGFGALFHDCATVAGWAYLERHIVEELLGGKLSHCIGGLTTDPVKRAGWVFALDDIHGRESVGSMIYGDTISFGSDFGVNRGGVAEYLLWDIMAQLECPTGHAVLPLPVTEALRVPAADEIAEAQSFGRRIEQAARRLRPHIDWAASREFAEKTVGLGKMVFTRALKGLADVGVDVGDPVQLLFVLKKLGPATFEEVFGAGEADEADLGRRVPVVPTDVYTMTARHLEKYREMYRQPRIQQVLHRRRLLIASTDVHEFAIGVIHQLLSEAGADMINLGAESDPEEVASKAQTCRPDAILISTHNGMALEYTKRLKHELLAHNLRIPVFVGGVLNQKYENVALPVDVVGDLKELGVHACPRLEGGLSRLLASSSGVEGEA